MSRQTKEEKLRRVFMGRDEQEKLHKVYENSKEVRDFRKDFHERIKNLGK